MADDSGAYLELKAGKFTFRFPKDLHYSAAGLWIRQDGSLLRIGLSDFAQQRNGDIAFVNLVPAGTTLDVGDEMACIETVKVDISLPSPVKGVILETNPDVGEAPELINQDPYGKGWIALVRTENKEPPPSGIFDAASYVDLARRQVEAELKP
jgi:glycine cleavage system H protein